MNTSMAFIMRLIGVSAPIGPLHIVFSEGKLPDEYVPCTTHPGHACCTGLRLTLGNGHTILSQLLPQAPTSPTPLEVIDWLICATHDWDIEEA